jgi:hypothetical protein
MVVPRAQRKGLIQMTEDFHAPHSSDWYDAMFAFDMEKGLHTLQVVSFAGGRSDICGVCGDDPAFDYHLPKLSFHDKTPVVVRWCEDCAMIQGFPGAYKIAL